MRTKSPQLKREIIEYINMFYRDQHRSPSFQEIGSHFEINKTTAYRYILEMSDEGSVFYIDGKIFTEVIEKCKTANVSAPVIGSVTCGDPTSEEENIEEYINLPQSIFGTGNFYILRAKGDSMIDAGIEPGNLVVIDKEAQLVKGDIVVALNEENENTLKRFDGYKNGKAILSYMNEKTYPGKQILVDFLVCQGVAKHIIKSL